MNGLLLDLDGTLYVGDAPLPGAVETIARLVQRDVPRRYLTNTTRLSRQGIAQRLQQMGFSIEEREIFSSPQAAKRWLAANAIERIALYIPEAAKGDFADFDLTGDAPEAIVIGDLGTGWSFDVLNGAFHELLEGARLVALQKNRYWRAAEGLALDAGPFVAALEYAAGTEAIVVGKPSADFFQLAAASLGLDPGQIVVIGDDVETDIAGAHAAGMRGVLVRTGKYREDVLARSGIEPAWIVNSLEEAVAKALA